jgi:hypothetical protein
MNKHMAFAMVPVRLSGSVADPDPGSGAFLTPGSGIRNGFIPKWVYSGSRILDPGSQTHIFESLVTTFG